MDLSIQRTFIINKHLGPKKWCPLCVPAQVCVCVKNSFRSDFIWPFRIIFNEQNRHELVCSNSFKDLKINNWSNWDLCTNAIFWSIKFTTINPCSEFLLVTDDWFENHIMVRLLDARTIDSASTGGNKYLHRKYFPFHQVLIELDFERVNSPIQVLQSYKHNLMDHIQLPRQEEPSAMMLCLKGWVNLCALSRFEIL